MPSFGISLPMRVLNVGITGSFGMGLQGGVDGGIDAFGMLPGLRVRVALRNRNVDFERGILKIGRIGLRVTQPPTPCRIARIVRQRYRLLRGSGIVG